MPRLVCDTTRPHQSARSSAITLAIGLALVSAGCNSMNGRMNNDIGQMYYRGGNYAMAKGEFQRAVANDPWNADYMHNLAMSMRRSGDTAGAEQMLQKALVQDPAHQPSYHGLALIMKEQGRTAEAQNLLSGWVAQQPYMPQAHVEMAWLQRETGDLAGAQNSLQQALKIKPNDPVATAHLGQIYQDSNQPQLAQAMYRKSLATKWYQPELQSRLASLDRGPGGGAPQMGPQMMGTQMAGAPVIYPAGTQTTAYLGADNSFDLTGSGTQLQPLPFASAPQPSPALANTYINVALPSTLADGSTMNLPADASGLQPVAAQLGGDPAHAGETTADLPVVQPY